ncbi:MAG: hypothetical protein V1791_04150, partial [Pseudomonadota bacterium]
KPVLWMVGTDVIESAREEEFNKWYNDVHVPEVLNIPGVISGSRYRAVKPVGRQSKYLALYEVEGVDLIPSITANPSVKRGLDEWRKQWGSAAEVRFGWFYEPIYHRGK